MRQKTKAYDITMTAVCVGLIAVCSWISIPTAVPFTLQTFGVFITMGLLGGKRGTAAVLVYIILGAAGVPVFSGFGGGIGALAGPTGGYIVGFLFMALAMWGLERLIGRSTGALLASMVIGLLVCYAFGTVWFMAVYARTAGAIGLGTVLGMCVIPFLIPDAAKIALAMLFVRRIGKYVKA